MTPTQAIQPADGFGTEPKIAPSPSGFWEILDRLVTSSRIVVDRPKGSTHPRYPDLIYPLDYGYLAGTSSGDGDGIDIWLGSERDRGVMAVACTADLTKRDAEIKILLGCSHSEIETIRTFLSSSGQGCFVLRRDRA